MFGLALVIFGAVLMIIMLMVTIHEWLSPSVCYECGRHKSLFETGFGLKTGPTSFINGWGIKSGHLLCPDCYKLLTGQ